MKTLTLCLIATFCSLFSFVQSLSDPTTSITSGAVPMYLSADRSQFASIENSTFTKEDYLMNAFRERENSADKCGKYKKLKTIGIIVASVGGGLFVTGIALIAIGVHDDANYGYNAYTGYYDGTDGGPLIAGGAACLVFGILGAGAGIPLAVIGSVKSHKYCGGGRDRSYMELSTKGNSLALKF